MKLTALALVILALGIVLGLALKGTATEAAPKWATLQFVDDSIEAFNQAVVQPIGAAVAQLQGDVIDLDQRVTALETGAGPLGIVTDRAFINGESNAILVDTDDGTIVGSYANSIFESGRHCQGTRQFLIEEPFPGDATLVDTVDGEVLGFYEAPPLAAAVTTIFSCSDVSWVNAGLLVIRNRALILWGGGGAPSTLLVDTDTGAIVASYATGSAQFSCAGDRAYIRSVGIVDTVTGALVVADPTPSAANVFVCQ